MTMASATNGEGHAEEVEEERGGVVEGVFDEDEGGSPDDDDCEEQEVGEGGWAEAVGQLVVSLRVWQVSADVGGAV